MGKYANSSLNRHWNLSRLMLVTFSMLSKGAKAHKRGSAHHEWFYVRFFSPIFKLNFYRTVSVRLGSSCVRLQEFAGYCKLHLRLFETVYTSRRVTSCHATFALHYVT